MEPLARTTGSELGPILDAGMTAIHGYEITAMLEADDFSAIRVSADIGGGNGSLISIRPGKIGKRTE